MQEFQTAERKILIQAARDSILRGLAHENSYTININQYAEQLRQPRACFVTLHINNRLRGCIGSLLAHQPLILDVIQNANNAAFKDPRFPPLTADEYPDLTLEISVLSAPQAMHFTSEEDLLQQIRPGIDGLILSDNGHRGTFLPSVWEQLPERSDFLKHLKSKAGLPTNYWSNTIQIENYTAELIS